MVCRYGRLEFDPKLTLLEKWLWYRMFGRMIGYGHNPLKSVPFWLILGCVVFRIGRPKEAEERTKEAKNEGEEEGKEKDSQLIAPSNLQAYENGKLKEGYPKFSFIVYSLDLFLPIIDLHQAKYWEPNANGGRMLFECRWFQFHSGRLLRLYMWIHILLGWLLTMLLVAGLRGLVRT